VSRSTWLVVGLSVASAMGLAGCQMLNLGQSGGSSDTTGGSTDTTPANLGNFTLELSVKQTTCGSGAMGLPDKWSFDVGLSHQGDVATWSSGGTDVSGQFDAGARSLEFTSSVTVDMRADALPGSQPLPACTIKRSDEATFTLDSVDQPKTLSGELTYAYAPTQASNCADLVYGSTPKFLALPCTVTYAVSGTLKKATTK
jgi:hypothetical protein